jgi:hypothetical protein
MTTGLMSDIYMFVLAILVGYEVITKVPWVWLFWSELAAGVCVWVRLPVRWS